MSSGQTLDERLERLLGRYDIKIAAIIVIADRKIISADQTLVGSKKITPKYNTNVYSIITEQDIQSTLKELSLK